MRKRERCEVTVQDTLRNFLLTELLAGQPDLVIADDDNLLLSGLVDSLGMLRLVAFIEAQFQCDVPPEDVTIENFATLRVIADYLERRQVVAARS